MTSSNADSSANGPAEQAAAARLLVWDLPVRLMHWGLVVCVAGSWLTRELEGDWFVWHTRFGYAVLVIVVTRILWGIVGTRHARFSDFVRGPRAIMAYLQDSKESAATNGHNPLGAVMILAFLAMLLVQALTGLFANDQVFETGPLFGYVTIETSDRLTTLHKQVFDFLVAAVIVHVIAAFFYLWVRRENLILPMITGQKPAGSLSDKKGIPGSRTWLAVLIAATVGAVLTWIVRTAPEAALYAF